MDLHGPFRRYFTFIGFSHGTKSQYDQYQSMINPIHFIIDMHRLLVFAQRQSNQRLAFYMAMAFYLQAFVGMFLYHIAPQFANFNYWVATAHPLSRIPVFFMGVCAGVLCTRIQLEDAEASQCKLAHLLFIFDNTY